MATDQTLELAELEWYWIKFSYVSNLGAFVGRWIPFLGLVILASDISQIVWNTTRRYNTIATEKDRLW